MSWITACARFVPLRSSRILRAPISLADFIGFLRFLDCFHKLGCHDDDHARLIVRSVNPAGASRFDFDVSSGRVADMC